MKITYKKHEISVRQGTSSSGETAFVTLDGSLRVFLGGLSEAKRFLRERAYAPMQGPRAASWLVRIEGSGGFSIYRTAEHAHDSVAYFAREQSRTAHVTRTELCTYPGCDGHGEINERQRSGRYVSRPCPQHAEPVTTDE